MDNLKLVQPKEKSVVHTSPSLRHIILLVVCDMVKYILKPVLLFGVKYTDGSDGNSLRSNPAMLAISFRHTAVSVSMDAVQVFVYRHSLLLARKRRGITVLNIRNHVADRFCQQRLTLADALYQFFCSHGG